jgi:hypothetical protein
MITFEVFPEVMNLEPKPEEAKGSKEGEMMPERKSSIPNGSESSTSGSSFTSIPTPAAANTIVNTRPKLLIEPWFRAEVDTLWGLHGRSTISRSIRERVMYITQPHPGHVSMKHTRQEEVVSVKNFMIQMRLEDCGGKVGWRKDCCCSQVAMLVSNCGLGINANAYKWFKRSRSPRIA